MDTDIGDKVIGGAEWKIFEENPYELTQEHPMEVDWWPAGKGNYELPFCAPNVATSLGLIKTQERNESSRTNCLMTGSILDSTS